MIGIRSITFHLPGKNFEVYINGIESALKQWNKSYSKIHTYRVSLIPVISCMGNSLIKRLSITFEKIGIRWFNISIDPSNKEKRSELFDYAHFLLQEYTNSFIHIVAVKQGIIDYDILEYSAKLIQKVSMINDDGRANFRLGISANVDPDGSFFPFSMSSGEYGFSIALELTKDINDIIRNNKNISPDSLGMSIIGTLSLQIDLINNIADKIAKENDMIFKGFDFSLAPSLEKDGSIYPILMAFGMKNLGSSGSFFATAYLTNLLKSFRNRYKMVGFSGVMYSLLEDIELASINDNSGITIGQLTAMSTMCGCGIDMIPVYGDITIEELIPVLLDIVSISCKLHKPLGIRILPIPGTKNDRKYCTNFIHDADFITNTKIVVI
jgi:uncharacterized protein (UPF0210 family)